MKIKSGLIQYVRCGYVYKDTGKSSFSHKSTSQHDSNEPYLTSLNTKGTGSFS